MSKIFSFIYQFVIFHFIAKLLIETMYSGPTSLEASCYFVLRYLLDTDVSNVGYNKIYVIV